MIEYLSTDKRFYIDINENNKSETIIDGDIVTSPTAELSTYRQIRINNDTSISGELSLGLPLKKVSDKHGNILINCLKSPESQIGNHLTYNGEIWEPTVQKSNLTLNTWESNKLPHAIKSEDIRFNYIKYIELDKNIPDDYILWTFSTPTKFLRNELNISLYYINDTDFEGDISVEIAAVDITDNKINLNNIHWTKISTYIDQISIGKFDPIDIKIHSSDFHLNNKLISIFIKNSTIQNRNHFESNLKINNLNIEYYII